MKTNHGCRPFIAFGVYPPCAEFYVIYKPSLDEDCWGDTEEVLCRLGKDNLDQTFPFPVHLSE